jgi:EmrB/QacA subfamily drug resistance transporter
MCLALVLVVASVSSVNLALAGISVDLGTSSAELTWIADGYTVALAALVLPFGALGDRFGRRSLLLAGTLVFGVAALMAAASQSAASLIACRVVMGVGAAMIMPGTLSTITAAVPEQARARAVSIWAGFASSGAILGLLTCGTILEWWSWRATFVATAVLAAVTFVTAWRLAPNTADPDEAAVDLPGSAWSAIGIGALVFGIIDGAEAGWTTPTALAGLGVALVSLLAFVVHELRTPHPMLDVRLFARRGFTTGSVAITAQFLCMFGFFLVGLQYLQLVQGHSALVSALCLLPMAAVVMPVSRAAPHVVERIGARRVMTAGLVLLGAGLAVMSRLGTSSSYWHVLGGLAVIGLGMALTSTPATTAIVTSLPRSRQGVASAMNDVSRELGAALGIAVVGSTFNRGYADAVEPATSGLPADAAHAIEESAGAGLALSEQLGAGGEQVASQVRDAFTSGSSSALALAAGIALAAAAVTAWRAPSTTSPATVRGQRS